MASFISIHENNFSSKITQYGTKLMASLAFLSENFSGIGLYESDNGYAMYKDKTKHRGILAAIRGSIMAQELREVSEKLIYSCYCAAINKPNEAQVKSSMLINDYINKAAINEIKKYVPKDIVSIMAELNDADMIFDHEEIKHEMREGRISKSKDLDNILLKNRITEKKIDLDEYGWEIGFDELRGDMSLNVYERALVLPFFEEYASRINNSTVRVLTYCTSNIKGYYVLSKLDTNDGLDFDFMVEFRTQYEGRIRELSSQTFIATNINFKRSKSKVNLIINSEDNLKEKYGEQKFTLNQKIPVLFKKNDATICLEGGCNVKKWVKDATLEKLTNLFVENIEKRIQVTNMCGPDIAN